MLEVDLSQAYTLEGALAMSCAVAFLYQLVKLSFRGKRDAVNQYQPFERQVRSAEEQPLVGEPEAVGYNMTDHSNASMNAEESGDSQEVVEYQKAAANEEKMELHDKEQSEKEDAQLQENTQGEGEKPIVLFVKPKAGETFSGYSLLKALADNDVHFSEQMHFQRLAESNGQGEVWFYVASLEQPGTFNMEEPGQINCPGLVLILDCEKVKQLMHAYDALIESAHQLAKDLEAEIFDDTMQPLARPKINQWRHTCARRAACVFS